MPSTLIATRGQTNCSFSWQSKSQGYLMRTRCRGVAHGFDVIAEESHARQYRAFYPHQVAMQPFVVTLELIGYDELKKTMDFLRNYIANLMEAANNAMTVSVPSRRFQRIGVPVGGIIDQDMVGSNVFLPGVVFETVLDPADPRLISGTLNENLFSRFDAGVSGGDRAARFFYPSSVGTNNPNATGDGLYASGGFFSSWFEEQREAEGRAGSALPGGQAGSGIG